MINKLKNQKGSAMQIAIIAIVLVGIGGAMITSMVINQIKSTHKASQTLDLKYDTEAGIEEVIGDFIDKINAKGFKREITEFNIVKLYVELAYELVQSNGVASREIEAILKKIGNGEMINKSEIIQVKYALQYAIGSEQGKSNPHADQLLKMALEYTLFIENNLFDTNGNLTIDGITFKKSQSFIRIIINDLTEVKFEDKDTVYGNISVAHRDTQCNYKSYKNLSNLYSNLNKDTGFITIKIKELTGLTNEEAIKTWVDKNTDTVIGNIEKTDYTNVIDNEISLIQGGGYLETSDIKNLYKTTGDVTGDIFNNIVKDRLKIIKLEIDMLIDWIRLMQNLKPDTSGGTELTERLIIEVPKAIEIKNNNNEIIAKTVAVNYDSENKAVNEKEGAEKVKLLDSTDSKYNKDFYSFEILKPPSTELVLNLDIVGKIQKYKIQTKVDVKINDILSKDKYEVDYEVKDWKKVNMP